MSIKEQLDKFEVNEENIGVLYNYFDSITGNNIPLIHFGLPKGCVFLRQRINKENELFTQIAELSYPPADCVKEYGRANVLYNPMFYGSTFGFDFRNELPLPRMLVLLETSTFAKDPEKSGIERSTCSKWMAQKDLNLIALPFSVEYVRPLNVIKQIQQEWEVQVKKYDGDKRALDLVKYMSDEIAKNYSNNLDYFKIAHFIYYLMRINLKTKEFDGILYPSVQAGGEGFNVALKPEVVDAYLSFEGASLCHLAKKGMDMYLKIMNYSKIVGEEIIYVDKELDLEEEKVFSEYTNGLKFIN